MPFFTNLRYPKIIMVMPVIMKAQKNNTMPKLAPKTKSSYKIKYRNDKTSKLEGREEIFLLR